jgi:hypothetical protein
MRHLPSQRRVPTITISTDTATSGRRMLAVGRFRPAPADCTNCGDFQTVTIKVDGRLVTASCIVCFPASSSGAVA